MNLKEIDEQIESLKKLREQTKRATIIKVRTLLDLIKDIPKKENDINILSLNSMILNYLIEEAIKKETEQ